MKYRCGGIPQRSCWGIAGLDRRTEMKDNWRTTVGGICMILAGVAGLGMTLTGTGEGSSYEVSFGLIAGGVAMLKAADA